MSAKHSSTQKVVVIFPARNEDHTIRACIAAVKQSKYNPSILVINGHSTDSTREEAKRAGAEVVLPEKRMHPGKGLAMKLGVQKALQKRADVIVFLDSDIENLSPEWVDKLVDCVVIEKYDMARGTYFREPQDAPVTKLVAKRLLWIFFPEVSHFEQPLTGEIAAKAKVLKAVMERGLPDGWGIDVAMLIETAMAGFSIKEVFLGAKRHRSYRMYKEDVAKLGRMSEQVAAAILQKAKKYDRIDNVDQILP